MQNQLLQYIKSNNLCDLNGKIICAVSGGVDSMVMAYILHKLELNIIIATCNFNLRDKESDKDQQLVKQFCINNNISFRTISFDTKKYAKEKKLSIQMAARELRYNWFLKLLKAEKADYIAIAHNLNDSIETFFINLSRGTGIKGLTGIKNKNGHIIRPLLFANRDDIYNFAQKENVPFREDATNAETKYYRNYIRHKIIPLFQGLNNSSFKNFENTIANIQNVEEYYRTQITSTIDNLVIKTNSSEYIDIQTILGHNNNKLIIFEWLNPKGFNKDQINNIELSIKKGDSGKIFYSDNYKLYRESDKLLLEPLKEDVNENVNIVIENINSKIQGYNISIINIDKDFKISNDKNTAQLDFEKIIFPLTISEWKKGDKFQPLGMNNNKLVSDFITDLKIPSRNKHNILTLKSEEEILWIVGYRIDNRYRITENTKTILQIKKV
ncbi:MAG: tRNA lysidine(34) synthetase TilS [Bacteroidales bacterium]|nr:tRNA lysidine(34) synthetase TilS [Bacteroidales bacterium]